MKNLDILARSLSSCHHGVEPRCDEEESTSTKRRRQLVSSAKAFSRSFSSRRNQIKEEQHENRIIILTNQTHQSRKRLADPFHQTISCCLDPQSLRFVSQSNSRTYKTLFQNVLFLIPSPFYSFRRPVVDIFPSAPN